MGSKVGIWLEQYFVRSIVEQVAGDLDLYADHKLQERSCRGRKVTWADANGDEADFDFVLELQGSASVRGIPVAFIESCWRRGTRHSSDKQRDDPGKLLPMRETYPTARFLGMIAAGDFSAPARDRIMRHDIDLFYIPKEKVLAAFAQQGLQIDYPDKAEEDTKQQLGRSFSARFDEHAKMALVRSLREQVGTSVVNSYVHRVRAAISALPQEIRFYAERSSKPVVFDSSDCVARAADFLASSPTFTWRRGAQSFRYEIVYTDGTPFSRQVGSLNDLGALHGQMASVARHVERLG